MPNFIITSYPSPLPTERVNNNSPAVAEVARTLAGRARWLYEMATGESAAAGETPGITKNPQNLYGVDHSGAPYGVAMQHGVGGIGRCLDSGSASNWLDAAHVAIDSTRVTTRKMHLWVKQHAEGAGPYSELSLDIRAEASASLTAEITLKNLTSGDSATVAAKALSTSFGFYSATLALQMASGRNEIVLEVQTATGTIDAFNWSINQTVQIRDS